VSLDTARCFTAYGRSIQVDGVHPDNGLSLSGYASLAPILIGRHLPGCGEVIVDEPASTANDDCAVHQAVLVRCTAAPIANSK